MNNRTLLAACIACTSCNLSVETPIVGLHELGRACEVASRTPIGLDDATPQGLSARQLGATFDARGALQVQLAGAESPATLTDTVTLTLQPQSAELVVYTGDPSQPDRRDVCPEGERLELLGSLDLRSESGLMFQRTALLIAPDADVENAALELWDADHDQVDLVGPHQEPVPPAYTDLAVEHGVTFGNGTVLMFALSTGEAGRLADDMVLDLSTADGTMHQRARFVWGTLLR